MFLENTDIYYLENFLTQEELEFVDERSSLFVVPNISSQQERYAEISDRVCEMLYPGEHSDILYNLNHRIQNLAKEVYKFPDDQIVQGINNFHMLYPPFSMQDHWDGTTPGVHYGIVVYVSDPSDYEGGEIFYSNKDIKIKPARGSIVLHPATEEYRHGVKQVTKGLRIAMSSFVQEEKHIGGPGNHGYN